MFAPRPRVPARFRLGRPLGFLLTFILLFTSVPAVPVSADAVPFAITANDLNGAVWEANANYQVAQSDKYEDVVPARYIADRFAQGPSVDPNEVIREVQVFQNAFSQQITHGQPTLYHDNHAAYETMLAAADVLEQSSPTLTQSTVQWVRQAAGGNWQDPQNLVSPDYDYYLGFAAAPTMADSAFHNLRLLAQGASGATATASATRRAAGNDPPGANVATVADAALKTDLGASVDDNATTIIHNANTAAANANQQPPFDQAAVQPVIDSVANTVQYVTSVGNLEQSGDPNNKFTAVQQFTDAEAADSSLHLVVKDINAQQVTEDNDTTTFHSFVDEPATEQQDLVNAEESRLIDSVVVLNGASTNLSIISNFMSSKDPHPRRGGQRGRPGDHRRGPGHDLLLPDDGDAGQELAEAGEGAGRHVVRAERGLRRPEHARPVHRPGRARRRDPRGDPGPEPADQPAPPGHGCAVRPGRQRAERRLYQPRQ